MGIIIHLDVESVDDDALVPGPMQVTSGLLGRLVGDESADEIQGRIHASADSSSRDDTETTEAHRGAASDGLAAAGALEGHAALSAVSLATFSRLGLVLAS